MSLSNSQARNNLDRTRYTKGANACISYFQEIVAKNRLQAIQMVNDDRLFFGSLFILQQKIKDLSLEQELNERNKIAFHICDKIGTKKSMTGTTENSISFKSDTVHHVLLWMFNTGAPDDGLSNEFDQVLDTAASVLVKLHQEEKLLPTVAELIFKRNRNGSYNHDLVWAFFQTKNVSSLRLIAGYLRSSNAADVELACTLLHLAQDAPPKSNLEKQKTYNKFLSWLNENNPYLYFTGESFQFSNSPTPCSLNLDAKYLCKTVSTHSRNPIGFTTEEELIRLNEFHKAQQDEKSDLANYSSSLYKKNKQSWSKWIAYPVDKQIDIARYGRRELI